MHILFVASVKLEMLSKGYKDDIREHDLEKYILSIFGRAQRNKSALFNNASYIIIYQTSIQNLEKHKNI